MFNKIPKNWEKVKLKKYVDIIRGVNYKSSEAHEYSNDSSTGVLRANNISNNGTINFEKIIYVDNKNVKNEQLIKKGDILIAMSSGSKGLVGKAAQAKKDLNLAFGAFCGVVRPKNINPDFVGYYFLTDYYRNKISELSTGVSINNLRKEYLENLDIIVPLNPDEQEEIVQVLDTMSEIIRLRGECIANAQNLILTIFQEMFGNPIKNNKKLETAPIKRLGTVITGATPPSSGENMFGNKIPFITPGDLGTDKYNRYLSEEGAKYSRMVRTGSTMVCCIGSSVGKVDIAKEKSAFNQQINAVEWNNNLINDHFALYLFRLLAPLIKSQAGGPVGPILNKSNFENIVIPKPDIELQEQFAQKAIVIEAYIKEQQEELKEAKQLLQSLLHHAFTGELTRRAYGKD